MEFKESQTFQNMHDAIIDKLVRSAWCRMYADKAREDHYWQISDVFCRISEQELQHAKVWQEMLYDGDVPGCQMDLQAALEHSQNSWMNVYREYAKVAREEGFEEQADMFERIATADRQHDFVLNILEQNIEKDQSFCRTTQEIWVCNRCGYIHWGDCAPDVCPICKGPQRNYEVYRDNY